MEKFETGANFGVNDGGWGMAGVDLGFSLGVEGRANFSKNISKHLHLFFKSIKLSIFF